MMVYCDRTVNILFEGDHMALTEADIEQALQQFKGRHIDDDLKREIHDVLSERVADHQPSLDVDVSFDKESGIMAVSINKCN